MREKREWTDQDTELLKKLRAERLALQVIAKRMGWAKSTIVDRVAWLINPDSLKFRRDRHRARYYEVRPTNGKIQPSSRPTAEMLEDAAKRLYAPRTITASFFGDPPPGMSALDRRQNDGI